MGTVLFARAVILRHKVLLKRVFSSEDTMEGEEGSLVGNLSAVDVARTRSPDLAGPFVTPAGQGRLDHGASLDEARLL